MAEDGEQTFVIHHSFWDFELGATVLNPIVSFSLQTLPTNVHFIEKRGVYEVDTGILSNIALLSNPSQHNS